MKQFISFLLLTMIWMSAKSQSTDNQLTGGEDATSKSAIESFKSTPEVQGYKVCIFSGSEQDAREHAKQDLELCYTTFPDINGEIVYDAPIFKVLVGACVNRIEAIRLLARLKATFPKSFVMSCAIAIDDFVKKESQASDSTQMVPSEDTSVTIPEKE